MLCGSLNEELTAFHNPIKSGEIKINRNVLHSIPHKWHLGKPMLIENVRFQSVRTGSPQGYSHQEGVLQDGMQQFKAAMQQARLYKPPVAP